MPIVKHLSNNDEVTRHGLNSVEYWVAIKTAAKDTPTLQKSEAFSLCVSKGKAVVNYCDPLIARRLGASGFPAG